MDEARVYIGVLRLQFVVPSARTRKDRRQVLRSFRDRVRHRYSVSIHELDDPERATEQSFVITSGGNNRPAIMKVLQEVAEFARAGAEAWPSRVDLEVFRWHPNGPTFTDFPTDEPEFENG